MQILNYNLEAYLQFDDDNVDRFLMLCEEALESITTDDKPKFTLKSALHELIINSLEHGYKKEAGKVSLSIKRENDYVFFEIKDEGKGIDTSKLNLNREVEDLEYASSRGWGLSLLNKLSSEMTISPNKPKGTKITLKIPI